MDAVRHVDRLLRDGFTEVIDADLRVTSIASPTRN